MAMPKNGTNNANATTPQPAELGLWRKSERERLIRERQAISSEQRQKWDAEIARRLLEVLPEPAGGGVISIYWPFRGEPDLRSLLPELRRKNLTAALPIVVGKGQPLQFRTWQEGDQLLRGVWNIPYPANGDLVQPALLLAPVVGFDRAGYRLGYGGGFFDRTLAAFGGSAQAFGVGYSQTEIATVYPQSYDIAMSAIVTESGVIKPGA
jgi:5-formyltetrahydrofolate cyclo-ligase